MDTLLDFYLLVGVCVIIFAPAYLVAVGLVRLWGRFSASTQVTEAPRK